MLRTLPARCVSRALWLQRTTPACCNSGTVSKSLACGAASSSTVHSRRLWSSSGRRRDSVGECSDTYAVPLTAAAPVHSNSSVMQAMISRISEQWRILQFTDFKPEGFGNFSKKKNKGSGNTPSSKKPGAKKSEGSSLVDKVTDSAKKAATKGVTDGDDSSGNNPSGGGNNSDGEGPEKDGDNNNNNKQKKDDSSDKSKTEWDIKNIWLYLGLPVLAAIAFGPDWTVRSGQNQISFQQFKTHMLEQGRVDHIEVVNKSIARVFLHSGDSKGDHGGESYASMVHDDRDHGSGSGFFQKDKVYEFNIGSVQSFEEKLELAQLDMGIDSADWVPVQYIEEISVRDTAFKLLTSGPILTLLIGLWIWRSLKRNAPNVFGGEAGKGGGPLGPGGPGGLFGVTKANFKLLNKGEKVKTRFSDVAGLDNAKEEIFEFVKFLKNPEKYRKLGARIPKGALLVGPPGTGKTLLARAVAGEADCPFFSISGSDFVEMFVGVGASRVRNLFEEARKNTPCIIFIDEIDAVGRKRSKGGFGGGNEERENTLNQLLVEMDGFKTDTDIVVLAGTNRKDILDSALLRPGRFDREIQIEKPDISGRVEIFKVHLSKLKLKEPLMDIAQRMATLTPGTSGADIANVCNEAALKAARRDSEHVTIHDFYAANDRILAGLEKRTVMTDSEKSLIAHHEAGHAVVGWFLEHADPLLKVTVIPRATGALGFAQYLPKELQLYTAAQLTDMMRMALGGRAAEQVFFGRVSTGASDDLNKVTKIAYGQISVYGMSDKVGNLSFPPDDSGQQAFKPYSERMAELMDDEAQIMVKQAYADTLALVTEKKELIAELARQLLEKETLGHDELVSVLGPRPFETDAYRDFLKNSEEFQIKLDNLEEAEVVSEDGESSETTTTTTTKEDGSAESDGSAENVDDASQMQMKEEQESVQKEEEQSTILEESSTSEDKSKEETVEEQAKSVESEGTPKQNS